MPAHGARVCAALLVAPADPKNFGIGDADVTGKLPVPTILVASRNDPWMSLSRPQFFAEQWGSRFVDLGHAGHINIASGHGPWPTALSLLEDPHLRITPQPEQAD